MPNVTTDVAREGWEIYHSSFPTPTWEQLNDQLKAHGLPGVSHRTYRHYGRMERCHETDYMPINELDQKWKGRS